MKRIIIVCVDVALDEKFMAAMVSAVTGFISLSVSEDVASVSSNVVSHPASIPRQAELPLGRKIKRRKDGTTWSALSEAFPVGQNFTLDEAEAQFVRLGYKASSASPAISQLVAADFLEKLSRTYWKFLKAVPANWSPAKAAS